MQLVLMSRHESNTEAKIMRNAAKNEARTNLKIFNRTFVNGRDWTERDEVGWKELRATAMESKEE